MIEPPVVLTTTPILRAYIHLTIPRSEMRNVMGPGLKELHEAVRAQGININGQWFTHHLRIQSDIFDFEISVPVESEVKSVGRVQSGEWPAIRVARTIYHGDYSGMGSAWGEFEAWINANGYTSAIDLWERYTVGPETTKDPTGWRTELNRPLGNI